MTLAAPAARPATAGALARPAPGRRPGTLLRVVAAALRLFGWGLLHWLLGFAAQGLELLAPALLAAGAAWWCLPHLAALLPSDAPLRDVIAATLAHLPGGLSVAGLWLTPMGLLFDGIGLMALAALLHTLSVAATELTFRRPWEP